MPIEWDEHLAAPTGARVVKGRGWTQVTYDGGSRHYLDTAPADGQWPALTEDTKFTSLTHALRSGVVTDWTGPTKYNIAKGVWADVDRLAELRHSHDALLRDGHEEEAQERYLEFRTLIAGHPRDGGGYAAQSLDEAADRGSAIHRAIEDTLKGGVIDYEDLAANGALPWVAAVHRFLEEVAPQPILIETVAFHRGLLIAGTTDALVTINGEPWIVDWKTRTGEHDRRPKEAIQLGGYLRLLTEGYFFAPDRMVRRNLDFTPRLGIVTFAPDGTWQLHEVDPAAAVAAFDLAMQVRKAHALSTVMPKRARKGSVDQAALNQILVDHIDRIPQGALRSALVSHWRDAGLGSAKAGEVEPGRFGEAMHLIHRFGAAHQPFPDAPASDTTYLSDHECAELAARLRALPDDLRLTALAHAAVLPGLDRPGLTTVDGEDWERVITPAEAAAATRRRAVDHQVDLLGAAAAAVISHLGVAPEHWLERHLETAALLGLAIDAGSLTSDLQPNPEVLDALAKGGKREATAKARAVLQPLGIDGPTKWADLVADPVLVAAASC